MPQSFEKKTVGILIFRPFPFKYCDVNIKRDNFMQEL
jgi:hypothetical protein